MSGTTDTGRSSSTSLTWAKEGRGKREEEKDEESFEPIAASLAALAKKWRVAKTYRQR